MAFQSVWFPSSRLLGPELAVPFLRGLNADTPNSFRGTRWSSSCWGWWLWRQQFARQNYSCPKVLTKRCMRRTSKGLLLASTSSCADIVPTPELTGMAIIISS